MNRYELILIYTDRLKDEVLEEAINKTKNQVVQCGGVLQNAVRMGRRQFARRLKKSRAGYCARLDFDMEPGNLDRLRTRLKLDENVFRTQILRGSVAETAPADEPARAPAPAAEGGTD